MGKPQTLTPVSERATLDRQRADHAFAERTKLAGAWIAAAHAMACRRGWLHGDPQRLHTTSLG